MNIGYLRISCITLWHRDKDVLETHSMAHSKRSDCQCSLAYKDPTLNLKPQKPRTVFTFEQLRKLECVFKDTSYPGLEKRQSLAEELDLPDERIRVWFQNRRAKEKRLREETLAMSVDSQKRKGMPNVHQMQGDLQPLDIPAFFAQFANMQPVQESNTEKLLCSPQSLHSHASQFLQFANMPPFWPPLHLGQSTATDAECSCDAELSPRSEEKLVLSLLKKARAKEKGMTI
eukprot:gene5929-11273_t